MTVSNPASPAGPEGTPTCAACGTVTVRSFPKLPGSDKRYKCLNCGALTDAEGVVLPAQTSAYSSMPAKSSREVALQRQLDDMARQMEHWKNCYDRLDHEHDMLLRRLRNAKIDPPHPGSLRAADFDVRTGERLKPVESAKEFYSSLTELRSVQEVNVMPWQTRCLLWAYGITCLAIAWMVASHG